jgi:hypothetical protein
MQRSVATAVSRHEVPVGGRQPCQALLASHGSLMPAVLMHILQLEQQQAHAISMANSKREQATTSVKRETSCSRHTSG